MNDELELTRILQRVRIDGECWHWTGGLTKNGYPRCSFRGETELAHRRSYELLVGPIPVGLQLDHLCHTHDPLCPGGIACLHRRCLNPEHLEPVTSRVNVLRSNSVTASNASKTHCIRGHPFDVANTYRRGTTRTCRACNALAHHRKLDR